ncbi:MAG: ATP-binding protein [Armatimonadota bacterium]
MLNNRTTEIQVPSNAAQCSRIRKVISRLAASSLRNKDAAEDVVLAFGEAFSNAVKYGENGGNVSVKFESMISRGLCVEMDYPGSKFDTTITVPKDKDNATGGFGRFIITKVMDSLEYSFDSGHTIVRMTKRI